MKLVDAQEARRQRAEELAERRLDELLDHVGLTEEVCLGTENVSPSDRNKLKGIINRLRGKKHAFATCMNDLRKHQPSWSEDRRKKTCAVLKSLAKPGSTNASDTDPRACVLLDASTMILLDMVDMEALAELEPLDTAGENFAVVSAAKRKKMPAKAFVFPSERRYPIQDRSHAANALARSKGTKDESTVKRVVCSRYSDLPACKKES